MFYLISFIDLKKKNAYFELDAGMCFKQVGTGTNDCESFGMLQKNTC